MSDPIIKKHLKNIDLIAFGVILLLTGATAFGCLVSLKNDRQTIQAKTQALEQDLNNLNILTVQLGKKELDLKASEARLAREEAKLPTSTAMNKFVSEIAKIAEDSGLKVNAINPHPGITADSYQVHPIEIIGIGSWNNCYKFLTGLRKMDRITRLDDLVIQLDSDDSSPTTPGANASKPSLCKMSVTISTFTAR